MRVSVDSGRDDARERARASMRIPRSAGCGHDWFSISSSSLSSSWFFPTGFLAPLASASWGLRSVVEEEEEEQEAAAVGEVEVDACDGEAGMGRWVGASAGGGC